jgi:hypothetical protein
MNLIHVSISTNLFIKEQNINELLSLQVLPNESVNFQFTIMNDTNKDELLLVFVQIPKQKLAFWTHDNDFNMGCDSQILKPSKYSKLYDLA